MSDSDCIPTGFTATLPARPADGSSLIGCVTSTMPSTPDWGRTCLTVQRWTSDGWRVGRMDHVTEHVIGFVYIAVHSIAAIQSLYDRSMILYS